MGKRKADEELERFVWKRNIRYDIQLLTEIEQSNPYASKNQKPIWDEIANHLLKHPMAMKVSGRSCRDRAAELLKAHRHNERKSLQTSGVGNEQETALQTLLTSVCKLEEAKPSKVVKNLFSTKDREYAEETRAKVVEKAGTDSEKENTSSDEKSSDDFEFGPDKKSSGKKPKSDLVKFLEAKNKDEIKMRKDELIVRKEELEVRKKEVDVERAKAEAESERNKSMMELLIKLVNPAPKE